MTVKELIEKLKKYDPDIPVIVEDRRKNESRAQEEHFYRDAAEILKWHRDGEDVSEPQGLEEPNAIEIW